MTKTTERPKQLGDKMTKQNAVEETNKSTLFSFIEEGKNHLTTSQMYNILFNETELEQSEKDFITNHIETCNRCRVQYETVNSNKEFYKALYK